MKLYKVLQHLREAHEMILMDLSIFSVKDINCINVFQNIPYSLILPTLNCIDGVLYLLITCLLQVQCLTISILLIKLQLPSINHVMQMMIYHNYYLKR